ncbi:LacI family DNA-binding transcriptional regulator [Bosea sp. Leaf344]|uniref:LacI family DNA-binding transcriptional regulator n=1 Tax=Bosea sp. Leaf344 TaxID=1736346 RepID=UPI000A44BFB9|nr:LacI family DNA-binding transcriptional regulator [Bosea sp. Leaf344]
MKDIAAELDLSVSTVARSLADSPRISRETRLRVAAAAERLGYVVDLAARAMRSGTSSIVGLIVPDIRNDFYSTAAKAIADCCQERGHQLVLAVTDDDPVLELEHLRNLRSARALGFIIIPSVTPAQETLRLMRTTPHVQFVRNCDRVESDWFGIEDAQAMRLAARHLIELGHRRIAYIGSTIAISTGRDRLEGFRATLREAGLAVDERLVKAGSCDSEFGYAAMQEILAEPERPTAVITAGARMSIGAYDCARAANVAIPSAMSFVGFSDSPTLRWCGEGLTTIALPIRELAVTSTDFLFRKASPDWKGANPCRVTLQPSLLVRGSTAAPCAISEPA